LRRKMEDEQNILLQLAELDMDNGFKKELEVCRSEHEFKLGEYQDNAKLEYKQISSKYVLQLSNLKLDEGMKLEGVTAMAEYEEKEYKILTEWDNNYRTETNNLEYQFQDQLISLQKEQLLNALDEDYKLQRDMLKREKKYALEVMKKNTNKLDLKKQLLAIEREYTDKEFQALQDQKKNRAETMQLLDANHQKALQVIKLRHEKEEKEMRQQHETERTQLAQMSHEMMSQIHAQHAERYRLLECEQKIHLLTLKSKMKTEYKAMKNIFDESEIVQKNQYAIKKLRFKLDFQKANEETIKGEVSKLEDSQKKELDKDKETSQKELKKLENKYEKLIALAEKEKDETDSKNKSQTAQTSVNSQSSQSQQDESESSDPDNDENEEEN